MTQEILTAIANLEEKTTTAIAKLDERTTNAFSEVRSEVAAFRKENNRRFESIDQQFESIEQRLEVVEQRLDKLETEMGEGFELLDGRLVSLEAKVEALRENKEWE